MHYTIHTAMSPSHLPPGLVRPILAEVDPYEPGRPISAVTTESGIQEVIKLGSNEGPFEPFPAAIEAIRAAAPSQRLYPDPGTWQLRDALSEYVGVPADHLQVGNGVDSLIKLVCLALLDPGDELVMGWPSFPSWRQGALMMGAVPRLVTLRTDGSYDLDGLLGAITDRTKMVVVVSPNNPTGAAVTRPELERFVAQVPDHVLVLVDEAYYEYMGGRGHDAASLVPDGRPLVALRTFSKIFGLAGLRVGYMCAPPELISAIGRVRNVFDVNDIASHAATASLSEADKFLPERIALNAVERARVSDALTALGLSPLPSDGNFVFCDLGGPDLARMIVEGLLARGIIIRPTGSFGAPDGIRITIGLPAQNDRLLVEIAHVRESVAGTR